MKMIKQQAPSVLGFSETPSHYLVRFNMLKFLGDAIRVEFKQDELIVRGRDRWEEEGVHGVSLKLDSDRPGVFARYRAGVLVVALPKQSVGFASLVASA